MIFYSNVIITKNCLTSLTTFAKLVILALVISIFEYYEFHDDSFVIQLAIPLSTCGVCCYAK